MTSGGTSDLADGLVPGGGRRGECARCDESRQLLNGVGTALGRRKI